MAVSDSQSLMLPVLQAVSDGKPGGSLPLFGRFQMRRKGCRTSPEGVVHRWGEGGQP
jgi:hypothetical protein